MQRQEQMQAGYQRSWCFALPGACHDAPAISARPGLLARALRRVGGQTIVLVFIVLDIGGLGVALVASAWLVPWITLNVAALLLGMLSWSEDWRIRSEGTAAARRHAERMRAAQIEREAECLREARRRQREEEEEREAQRRLQVALQQAEEQLREAEERQREHEEAEREAQRREQAEAAERLRQAQEQQEAEQQKLKEQQEAEQQKKAEQQKAEEQRREAEQRRRQAEEEGRAQRERQRKRKPAPPLPTDWWTILGVAPSARKEEIVRSYRRKIKECHPDRLAGVAPPLLQMAEEQAKVLNGAYANAMRARR